MSERFDHTGQLRKGLLRDLYLGNYEQIWESIFLKWPEIKQARELIDVGPHDWATIPVFAPHFTQLQKITGVEILGRRFLRGFKRLERVALQNATPLLERGVRVEYRSIDFLDFTTQVRPCTNGLGIVFAYPFVHRATALQWGLRPGQIRPWRDLLTAAIRLRPDWILSIHQGEWEALLARQQWEAVLGASKSILIQYDMFKNKSEILSGRQRTGIYDAPLFFVPASAWRDCSAKDT